MNVFDAGELVYALHGKAFRMATAKLGSKREGLPVAAKDLLLAGHINQRRRKKLVNIDLAYHLCRHISVESIAEFLACFEVELNSQDTQDSPASTVASINEHSDTGS